jgi:hypothetical protein
MSRGSERREKLRRMRLCKIFTMTKFADEYDEILLALELERLEPVAWFDSVALRRRRC